MSGRQLLPRLLQRASRLVTANSTPHVAHRPAPCGLATRASWLSRYEVPTSASWSGSRGLCTTSMLAPGLVNRVNSGTGEVGFTTAGGLMLHTVVDVKSGMTNEWQVQVQQRRALSKLKKTKIKAYSSYKKRFRGMANGEYKRWRSGTRHNAHSKTNKQRRQLRRPSVAPLALAKVMKKLNFMG